MNNSIINEINILSQNHTIDEYDIRDSNQQHHRERQMQQTPPHQPLETQTENEYEEHDI